MIQLTKKQLEALETVEWLLDDTHGSGKSFLLAVAFIRKAIREQGEKVYVYDVSPGEHFRVKEYLLNQITEIFINDSQLQDEFKLKCSKRDFSILLERKIDFKNEQRLWDV